MSAMREFFHRLNMLFHIVTDWLLIVIGLVLVVKAWLSIDVPAAKYVILTAGAVFMCIGLWCRHRRKRREAS